METEGQTTYSYYAFLKEKLLNQGILALSLFCFLSRHIFECPADAPLFPTKNGLRLVKADYANFSSFRLLVVYFENDFYELLLPVLNY